MSLTQDIYINSYKLIQILLSCPKSSTVLFLTNLHVESTKQKCHWCYPLDTWLKTSKQEVTEEITSKNAQRFVVSFPCSPYILTDTVKHISNFWAQVWYSYKNFWQSVEEPDTVSSDTFHKLWVSICSAAPRRETCKKTHSCSPPKN